VQRNLRHVPALLLLTSLAAACGGSSEPAASSPLPSPSLASSAAPVASSVPSDNAQQTISLTVSGGKVTGDTGRVKVALGTRVRITVTSDVADEIHVHVYDLKQEVSANASASIEFVADKPGVVDVELERSKLTLTRLAIS
jgi:hypothetical protein